MLTVAQVKALKEPGKYRADPTLYLNIAAGGSKSWLQRVTIDGRRHDIGLGGFPAVSLAQARRRAADNRTAVADGRNPLAEKRRPKTPTFAQAAEAVHKANRPRWRNERHAAAWLQTLERHAFPTLGDMPIDRIDREDVLSVLTPIWTTKPETARRVRQRIRTTLAWAQAHRFVEHNAADGRINPALPSMAKTTSHLRALPYKEVPAAFKTIAESGDSPAKLCLQFTILTAARNGESRGARWSEIDLGTRQWRIPAERMKSGAEHRQPLSDAALAVLEKARALNDGSDLVFPSPIKAGQPLSDMALTKVLRDHGLAMRTTVHGFRSAFKTWSLEATDAGWETAEMALAHAVGDAVARAYLRGDGFERRVKLMQDWAAFAAA